MEKTLNLIEMDPLLVSLFHTVFSWSHTLLTLLHVVCPYILPTGPSRRRNDEGERTPLTPHHTITDTMFGKTNFPNASCRPNERTSERTNDFHGHKRRVGTYRKRCAAAAAASKQALFLVVDRLLLRVFRGCSLAWGDRHSRLWTIPTGFCDWSRNFAPSYTMQRQSTHIRMRRRRGVFQQNRNGGWFTLFLNPPPHHRNM